MAQKARVCQRTPCAHLNYIASRSNFVAAGLIEHAVRRQIRLNRNVMVHCFSTRRPSRTNLTPNPSRPCASAPKGSLDGHQSATHRRCGARRHSGLRRMRSTLLLLTFRDSEWESPSGADGRQAASAGAADSRVGEVHTMTGSSAVPDFLFSDSKASIGPRLKTCQRVFSKIIRL